MARFYYIQIKLGKKTMDDVPEKWWYDVQAMLDADLELEE